MVEYCGQMQETKISTGFQRVPPEPHKFSEATPSLQSMEDVVASLRAERSQIVHNMHMVHQAGVERLSELDIEIRTLKSNPR